MNQEGMLRRARRRVASARAGRDERDLLAEVFTTFAREVSVLGLDLPLHRPEFSRRSRLDPVSGDESLECSWCNDYGQQTGGLVVNPDGSFYAEQKVRELCPSDRRWTVESIRAWGWSGGEIRSEVRLLPAFCEN